ncbi:hypothetical protein GWI33_004509 [Rhynchophorus ferrugineus]|uniref:Uncharacterized protein n=1 Tax=Rhynchophorus ferrugineus TaxID=354439 RepID=A0A834IPY5_RHYFE|nr:hypothetical protein GWI33_004509 [Rhynchophorus ferrugineus]
MYIKLVHVVLGLYFVVPWVTSQYCEKCKILSPFSSGHSTLPSTGGWVVRPKSLPRPSVTLPLYGSGSNGPCFRKPTIVKPAPITKQICLPEKLTIPPPSDDQSCSNETNKKLNATCINLEGYQPIEVSKAYERVCEQNINYVPADAVSLAIAYKLAQNDYNRNIQEDKLLYGFRKLPAEVPCPKIVPPKITKALLPEGNLYDINGEIVELKTKRTSHVMTEDLEQEAVEDMIDMVASNEDDHSLPIAKPSLSDLGYRPARFKSATFVDICTQNLTTPSPAETESSESCEEDQSEDVTEVPCNDPCSDEDDETIIIEESCEDN